MRRIAVSPRPDWETKVEALGLTFHHTAMPDGQVIPYWDETAYYSFRMESVLELERVTNELHQLCIEAAQHVIVKGRFGELAIPKEAVPRIIKTWEEAQPSIYGRFDFWWDGDSPPKLLEYNADTPTAVLEAAVIQWQWLEERFPGKDQFNSIHERLIEAWKRLRPYLWGEVLHFAHAYNPDSEDMMTTNYLRDTAEQAGIQTAALLVDDIGWDQQGKVFLDLEDRRIRSIFKLYPWEWILQEEFGPHVLESYKDMQWIEPIWKMLLSNKGILAVLWELYPGHPNLLPTYLDGPRDMQAYVRKPILGREGSNISVVTPGSALETPGGYGQEGFVYQAFSPLPVFDGFYPVIGSWVIEGEAAGMGIREAEGWVTRNWSRFVPHLIED
ncbi:MAG: glutathionylspermidine synthase family protein [Dehalococcoidia bacterium]|nr:glutathionylspermidine synthase family protein [Dehalococcoidia bacterium]